MKFNHNLFRNAIKAGALGLLAVAVAACDDDPKPDWSETAPAEFQLTAQSIAEGATVPASTPVVTFTYSTEVAVNSLVSVTLNGTPVQAQLADSVTVSVALSLAEGQSYTLVIPDRAIAGRGTKTFAKGLTLNFSTEGGAVVPSQVGDLVNANAMQAAKNVYAFLKEQSGKKILSGAMANVNNNNDFSQWVSDLTTKWPAITGYDFIHLPESAAGQSWVNYADITPAQSQWQANGLVQYMWHWRVPTDKTAYDNKDYDKYGARVPGDNVDGPTDFDIREALKEGTWQHEVIMNDLAEAGKVLKQLQDAGIPVIWRPLHEAAGSYKYNGAWFWWGRYGDEYTKELWKLMYDELVNKQGLNNLIWVWTAQYEEGYENQMAASYVGNEYCDMIGVDIYADNDDAQLKAYNALLNLCGGKKLVTISETGLIQNPAKCLAAGANWSYFMLWYTYDALKNGIQIDDFGNTKDSLIDVFTSAMVINRSDMPSLK